MTSARDQDRADLPDVPEAAVEAIARAMDTNWLVAWDDLPEDERAGLFVNARIALRAALRLLIEQGWKPPETEAQSNG